MDGSSDSTVDLEVLQVDTLLDSRSGGMPILIVSTGDPFRYAVNLRLLCTYGAVEDTAFVVTSTERVNQTIETYGRLGIGMDRPSLGIVDTTSEQQSMSALYGETPVVFTPAPEDLERLVLALSDLSENTALSNGACHLVVRSLTPILESVSTARVYTVLEQITDLRSETGLCLIGLDYAAHDERTMATVADRMDGVLWVTQPSLDHLAFEYQPTRGRSSRSVIGGDTDD